ncbi:motile sperm domain-containing protein 1 isoform X2 [Octopus sinensis]|nr:motile sperm domain-containing protein 1 isoform X2 [Octopus sinensis]XP_036360779.1 motile sperm domain-containing protein 1 isoform X2 [Octopus sinensis]
MFKLPLEEGKLPVFVFPQSLSFYLDDSITHKQVLTLYNPYDFSIRFKVLGTSPQKYSVDHTEGTVKSKCCVDIVVKHRQLIKSNDEVKDKFLIHIYHHGKNRKTLGKREISATLYSTRVSLGSRLEDNFQALPNGGKVELKQRLVTDDQTLTKWPSMFLISLSMICIAVLMLPNEGTTPDTMVPSFLRVTVNQKCVAAYVLGAITMILLKSYS